MGDMREKVARAMWDATQRGVAWKVSEKWEIRQSYFDKASAALLACDFEELVTVLTALVDDDECRLDHSGFCQTHTNEMDDGQCVMVVARALLAKVGASDA